MSAEGSDFLCAPEKCHAGWNYHYEGQLSMYPVSDREPSVNSREKVLSVKVHVPGNQRRTLITAGSCCAVKC